MKNIAIIGNNLKKIYRKYNSDILELLQEKGFIDLRASFIEILIYLSNNDAPSIKEVGDACGLKKQTMTSHVNELESRGYIIRKRHSQDKREQRLHLTDYGLRFKLALFDSMNDLEKSYIEKVGALELDRINLMLQNFIDKS